MKNVTLQLFEYLLAAQNSNLSVNYNLNKYPAYWFLDEILSWGHIQLENTQEGRTCIKIHQPNMRDRKVEVSIRLSAILNLMQYQDISNDHPLISKDELEANLRLEADAIRRKIETRSKEVVIINDWQQLLLGVNQVQISMEAAIQKQEALDSFIEEVLVEYQIWKDEIKQRNIEHEQALKTHELYAYILNSNDEANGKNQLNLGIGILHIPGVPPIYHPLLTLNLEVVIDRVGACCELIFEDQLLKIDQLLDHVLFYDLEVVKQIQQHIREMNVTPFNNHLVANVLQKIVNYIHPDGRYFASPVDAALASEEVPQVLHRSVIFVREQQMCMSETKLKSMVEYLSNNKMPSDVIGSIVDPNYPSFGDPNLKYGNNEFNASLFVWPTDGVEEQILNLLDQHHAVAVFEEEKGDKSYIIANLITHLMATEKRVLVVGENHEELDHIQEVLPLYLSGLHTKLSTRPGDHEILKQDLVHLRDKKASYRLANLSTDKINDEIEQVNVKLNEIIRRIVDYRELGSKKIFWKDRRYHPYELAQLISKLGGKDYLNGDSIPLDKRFDMKDSEIQKIWELRCYFTPENLSLLRYEFIDINELKSYHEYQKMLVAEERYLQLLEEDVYSEEMFDQTTDIRFVQYLFDQLPKLIKDVSEIKTSYGKKILKQSLTDLESYHTLASSLDRINRGLKDIELLDGSNEEREVLIKKLNQMFGLEMSALDDTDQNQLIEFYASKRTEMTSALRAAHLVLVFNEGAMALSKSFKGVSAEGIDMMNVLYHAAAVHLSKVEFEICWFRVKSYFMRIYQPIIQKEYIHPLCVDMYEALTNDRMNEFREVLEEIENLVRIRQNFVTFGDFMARIGDLVPMFTTSVMSDPNLDTAAVPDFKEAIDKGKLNGLFDQLHFYESEFLDQGIEYLKECQLKLQHELIEKESWKNKNLISQSILMETIKLIEDKSALEDEIINNALAVFQALFVPLSESEMIKTLDPTLFDLVIFVDATSSNVMRMTELIHGHKAILFGNTEDKLVNPLSLRQEDFQKLANRYGRTLQRFGEQYFEASLFNLMVNSAAWDAQVKLPKQVTQMPIKSIGEHVKSGTKKCESPVEDEIFEALVKLGYEVKCKVKVGKTMLDFLIIGKSNVLAVNIVGDEHLQRESIKSQLEQEIELRRKGLNIHTVQAAHFYLNSRKTLLDLCDTLEKLEIYPLKT